MSDPIRVRLNLIAVTENLSKVEGREVSVDDATKWLNDQGFIADGDDWLAVDYDCLGILNKNEVLRYEAIAPEDVLEVMKHFANEPAPQAAKPKENPKTSFRSATIPPLAIVPTMMCGRRRDASVKIKKALKRVLATGDWAAAAKPEEFIPIEEAPGDILRVPPMPSRDVDDVHAYLVREILESICENDNLRVQSDVHRALLLSGIDQFWICLSLLSDDYLYIIHPDGPHLTPEDARFALAKIYRWWPTLVQCDRRFSIAIDDHFRGWPNWCYLILRLCAANRNVERRC